MTEAQKGVLYRQLATYVRSGFGWEKALESLLSEPRLAAASRTWLEAQLGAVRGGASIAGSLQAGMIEVSELELRLVEAGEKSGQLEHALTLARLERWWQVEKSDPGTG